VKKGVRVIKNHTLAAKSPKHSKNNNNNNNGNIIVVKPTFYSRIILCCFPVMVLSDAIHL